MKTTIICLTLLAAFLLMVTPASADKSYNINLSQASRIGNTEIKAGDYKLVVDAPKVRLVEMRSGKAIDLEAKIQTGEEKFNTTAVHAKTVDGVTKIVEIKLGGSKTSIVFD